MQIYSVRGICLIFVGISQELLKISAHHFLSHIQRYRDYNLKISTHIFINFRGKKRTTRKSHFLSQTLCLHDYYLEVLTAYGNELHQFFGPRPFPLSSCYCRAFNIEVVDTTFNIFSYDTF